MRERLRETVGEISTEAKARGYWFLIDHIFHIRQEGNEHLLAVREHLEQGGSVMVLPNHESLIDPGVVVSVVHKSFGALICRIVWPGSTKFFPDLYDTLDPAILKEITADVATHKQEVMTNEAVVIHAICRHHGIEMLPIVQDYRMGKGKFLRVNVGITTSSLARFSQALKEGGTMGALALEGTRSPDGRLQAAQEGIGRIFRDPQVGRQVLLLPLGLIGTRDVYDSERLQNLHAPVTVRFGPPFAYEQARADAQAFHLPFQDILMLRVARLLPTEKLGYYSQPQFSGYLEFTNGDSGA